MLQILRTLLNFGFVIMFMLMVMKVRDHFYITGEYRDSAHRDCNTKVKLSHQISILFHNLKNCDSYLIMQFTR